MSDVDLDAWWRRDPEPVLWAESVRLLADGSETYPAMLRAIAEAQAAGTAVVASAIGGTPELITDGDTGLLVPAGDAAALAYTYDFEDQIQAVETVLADLELGAKPCLKVFNKRDLVAREIAENLALRHAAVSPQQPPGFAYLRQE